MSKAEDEDMAGERRFAVVVLVIFAIYSFSLASGEELLLQVCAPKVDCKDVPVCADIELPQQLAGLPATEIGVGLRPAYGDPNMIPGQIVIDEGKKPQLWWIIPRARAKRNSTWIATIVDYKLISKICCEKVFSWENKKDDYLDLIFNGRKAARYMYAYDVSNPQRVFETYKPFLHVFDAQGENLLTNGPDGIHPYVKNKVLYPHHRGIFIGWNRLEFGGQRYDFWHMSGGVQVHQKFLALTAGPVLARFRALIHWNDKNGMPVIVEQRETTIFRQSSPAILLLEFQTELKAVRADVYLNGDPEHAGFQYRAHNDVASGGPEVKATYLFHEDGIDPKKDVDLPWAAMSYGLNGRQYSVQYMNHPHNPKPFRIS